MLGRPDATTDDTFVDLGGDSLSYVEVSARLADALGTLPHGLAQAHSSPAGGHRGPGKRGRRLVAVDTTALLRAVAITMVVASHADIVHAQGGAHVLLAVAGFNLARFQLGIAGRAARVRGMLAAVARSRSRHGLDRGIRGGDRLLSTRDGPVPQRCAGR